MRTSLIAATVLPVALALGCSGDEKKKSTGSGGSAGTSSGQGGSSGSTSGGQGGGGQAGTAGGGTGGTGAMGGAAGMGGMGGTGGTTGGTGAMGGSAGTGGMAGTGGTAGTAGTPSVSDFIFTVDSSAVGLTGTEVESQSPNPESNIYGSAGTGRDPMHQNAGTNALFSADTDLGLMPTDDIDGVSFGHPKTHVVPIWFSVADDTGSDEGLMSTDVRGSSDDMEDPGDIFLTFGGEDEFSPGAGRNLLRTDEYRIGLQPVTPGGTPLDNVNGIDRAVESKTRVYFTLLSGAQGAAGSGVAGVPANEVGCTIFQSDRDGTNSVALSCDDIGLVPGDEVDALVAFEDGGTLSEVWFSVNSASTGKMGSAVLIESMAGEAPGDIFVSDGMGSNQVQYQQYQLGLQPQMGSTGTVDELDALAVQDDDGTNGVLCLIPNPTPLPKMPTAVPPDINSPRLHSCTDASPTMQTPDPSQKIVGITAAYVNLSTESLLDFFLDVNAPFGPGVVGPGLAGFSTGALPLGGGGEYLMISVELEGPFPLDDDTKFYQYGIVLERDGNPANNYVAGPPCPNDFFDGTDTWFEITKFPGNPWQVSATDVDGGNFSQINPVGWVSVVGNTFTLYIPESAFMFLGNGALDRAQATVRASAFCHEGDFGRGMNAGPWSGGPFPPVAEPMVTPVDL